MRAGRRTDPYFNSRPSARGDATSSTATHGGAYFNSRPSARSDEHIGAVMRLLYISIHAPPRGATNPLLPPMRLQIISIHAPPRGATVLQPPCALVVDISIHAPPRGATGLKSATGQTNSFQFTPLREGRHGRNVARLGGQNFNSRPSARGDVLQPPCALVVDISIHAPPRGATRRRSMFVPFSTISIHAPPRGATRPPAAMCSRS